MKINVLLSLVATVNATGAMLNGADRSVDRLKSQAERKRRRLQNQLPA